ncbi:MAG: phage head morphogenesis protein, partial [Burkholderiaceae bacterium]|nr:phage head morphogenesis protein [Burkholderiaceae bacterium]
MIDPLLDHTIRHSVDMAGYGNFVLAKMIRILNLSDADMMAALNAALADVEADSFKVQRLDKMLASLREVNAQAYAALYGGMTKELESYVGYEGQFQYDLYKAIVPVTFSIASVVPEQVYAAAVAQPMQGRLLKDWAANLSENRLRRIQDTIAVGYTQGKTTTDIVREIKGTKAMNYADGLLDTSRREVDAVVRTALSHTAQITRNRFYDANDDILGDEMWVATLDGRTSPDCRARDHHLYKLKTHEPVGHSIPWRAGPGRIHWCCRSSSVALLRGQTELYGTRASAGGPVSAKLSYNDWLRQQSASTQDEIMGKAKGARYRADGMSDAAFVNNKGRTLSLKEMRERDERAFKQPQGTFTIYDPGFPRLQPDVSTPARATAVKLEDQIRGEKNEFGAFVSKDGGVLLRRAGLPDKVPYTEDELRSMKGTTFTHNHPGGLSFSVDDVRNASFADLVELRAVAPHYRHTMTPKGAWPGEGQVQAI